nr:hypothetical protein [Nanoarchaeum sp.]
MVLRFDLDRIVFEGVSSVCVDKTREILSDTKLSITICDTPYEGDILRVLPKKAVVGNKDGKRIIGNLNDKAIIYFPENSRSYIQWLNEIKNDEYVMDFIIGNSAQSGDGINCLSIRRLEDQFTLYFFVNPAEAREYSEFIRQ